MIESPWYPIVYIRGYAGNQTEVEDTVATPYMGFNLGSTKLRQSWTGDIERHVFESPLIRLMKDAGYSDVYEAGAETPVVPGKGNVSPRSVWIYRYYDDVSKDLGTGTRPGIEHYAHGLRRFIDRIQNQVCGNDQAARDSFRVYLVAHSMGGLIVRCYLQNVCQIAQIPHRVDKVFTYATPHGGIDFRLIGNVPAFVRKNNVDNFNHDRMRDYLRLSDQQPVNTLTGFTPSRFFCLVGTNARDYAVAQGLSTLATGPMGDGLVQIKNAYVSGAPRAFVNRSHSGHYGIVNSEEGYQNLKRFLFGAVKVDGFLDVDDFTLPPKVQRARDDGKEIRASYHIEVIARVRGARWDLHRRTVDENSAIFLPYDQMRERQTNNRPIQLLSAFLEKNSSSSQRRRLGFSVDIRVHVPEYEVDGWLFDDHYDGGYLFRDKINLEVTVGGNEPPALKFGFDSRTPNRVSTLIKDEHVTASNDRLEFRIPLEQKTRPGMKGTLILRTQPWN